MGNNVLQAEAMGIATLSDPQFKLPLRPAMAPGLVVIPTDHGLLVEGGPARQLFGGDAGGDLRSVWSALDGSRGIDDVALSTNLEERRVHSITSLLYASGLLEDASDVPEVTGFDEQAMLFMRRSIDSSRVNISGAHAANRLQRATVCLVANDDHGDLADALHQTLSLVGFGSLKRCDAALPTDATYVIVLGSGGLAEAAADNAARLGIPVLPAQLVGECVYYGPQVHPDYSLSYQDLTQQIAAENLDGPRSESEAIAAELIAGEVLTLISRVGHSMAQQALVRLNLTSMKQDRLVAVESTKDGMPLAYAFEASTVFAPRELSSPRDHQVHYKSSNLALTMDSMTWPSAPTLPFNLSPSSTGKLEAAALSQIIRYAAGNRHGGEPVNGKVQRWAPTGGNLGSVQVYLIVRNVPGLETGGYGFERGDDSLAILPWVSSYQSLAGLDLGCAVSVVLTGALSRVASKYSAFAWRIIHLDAGVASAHLDAAASDLGFTATAAPIWDDTGISNMLGINLDHEPITSVINISATKSQGAEQ